MNSSALQTQPSCSLQSTASRVRGLSLRPPASLLLHSRPTAAPRTRQAVVTRAGNPVVEVLLSGVAGAAAAAVATVTAENRDKEIERIQTAGGAIPVVAAIAADAIAHSVPGVNVLLPLLTEPAGAAAGVAYLMSVVLSSPAVDPSTLAPAGTLLNAEKAKDARANVRVPFTQILPTALKVVDTSNEGSSGAGWKAGASELPKLPITSVLAVVGVGGLDRGGGQPCARAQPLPAARPAGGGLAGAAGSCAGPEGEFHHQLDRYQEHPPQLNCVLREADGRPLSMMSESSAINYMKLKDMQTATHGLAGTAGSAIS